MILIFLFLFCNLDIDIFVSKKMMLVLYECDQMKQNESLSALVQNYFFFCHTQMGFTGKCNSPNEHFSQIENWKCHMFDFRLISLDCITYTVGKGQPSVYGFFQSQRYISDSPSCIYHLILWRICRYSWSNLFNDGEHIKQRIHLLVCNDITTKLDPIFIFQTRCHRLLLLQRVTVPMAGSHTVTTATSLTATPDEHHGLMRFTNASWNMVPN